MQTSELLQCVSPRARTRTLGAAWLSRSAQAFRRHGTSELRWHTPVRDVSGCLEQDLVDCTPRYHREMFPGKALTWTHSNRGPCQERQHFESSPRILEHAAIPLLSTFSKYSGDPTHRSCVEPKFQA